jgi:hypothetical protein
MNYTTHQTRHILHIKLLLAGLKNSIEAIKKPVTVEPCADATSSHADGRDGSKGKSYTLMIVIIT